MSVETVSLTDLLSAAGALPDFDYLSVDTEGSEWVILAALDWNRFRPKVITVEHNYTPLRDELRRLLEGLGYRRELTLLSLWDDWYYWP